MRFIEDGVSSKRERNKKLLLLLVSCMLMFTNISRGQNGDEEKSAAIPFHPDSVQIKGELDPFTVEKNVRSIEKNLYILTIKLKAPTPHTPPEFSLNWHFPALDIHSYWNSDTGVDKVNFYNSSITTRAVRHMPVLAYLNHGGINRLTFAVSDAMREIKLRSNIKEEDANVYNRIILFSEQTTPRSSYKVKIRFDLRSISYEQTLRGVSRWWAGMDRYTPARIPRKAKMPVYSTWYNFHQDLDKDTLLKEFKAAHSMGFETVILDDGWQTRDTTRGYDYTGDWKPEGIPDMKEFVEEVHSIGMNLMLWYSVPLVGKNADNFDRFRGMYLREGPGGSYVLDPRYPEVRKYLINTYVDALKNWDVDGFKLDFLGWFAPVDSTRMLAVDGRDIASVNRAVDRLMTDIMNRLRSLDPDIMIEFRQPYVGPLMRKYGNMFRAVDAPNMGVLNRARIANLRLMADSTAVHSDMYMWHPSESVESAARQVLNTLLAVPQLSVRIGRLPESHRKMIEFYTRYQKNYGMVLQDAQFKAPSPAAVYPLLVAYEQDHTIYGLYEPMLISQNDYQPNIHVINATADNKITIDFDYDLDLMIYQVYSPTGEELRTEQVNWQKGVHQFNVPESGMMKIKDFSVPQE